VALVDRQTQSRAILWSLLVLLLCAPTIVFAQAAQGVALRATGEVPNHIDLSVADIAAFQRQTIRVTDDKGTTVEYGGVPGCGDPEKSRGAASSR